MSLKVTYVADIAGDIDDMIAIKYLHSHNRLEAVVLDGQTRDDLREQELAKIGICLSNKIETDIVFCGGAFTKIANHHQNGGKISLVVCNGFFAGDNLVPKENRLPKFDGKLTCPSYNPNLNPKAAEYVLRHCRVLAVSKNVCHHPDNVINKWHESFDCPPNKKLHDLLMVKEGLNLIDGKPMLCEYATVYIYRNGNEWGAVESEFTDIEISIYKK